MKKRLLTLFCLALTHTSASYADIHFVAKVYGPVTDIYKTDENKNVTKLTNSKKSKILDFDVSEHGDVVFSSYFKKSSEQKRNDYDIRLLDIEKHKAKGDEKHSLSTIAETSGNERLPIYSPSGMAVAYIRVVDNDHSELRIAEFQKGKENNDRLIAKNAIIHDFSWSPSGKEIVYAAAGEDYTALLSVDVKKTKPEQIFCTSKRLKASPSCKEPVALNASLVNPVWSPDGKHIAYIIHPNQQGKVRSLHTFNIKKKTHQQLSNKNAQVQSPIHWSNDNNSILYSALIGYSYHYDETVLDKVHLGGLHIFLSDINGTHQKLTKGDHFHGSPVFSPDENAIAYLFSERVGGTSSHTLRTMKRDGSNIQDLYSPVAKGSRLSWK